VKSVLAIVRSRGCVAALALLCLAPAARPQGGAAAPINPMTGEPEETEELRTRLARLQIQSRIETELTSIERSRQERRRVGGGEGRGTPPPGSLPGPRARGAQPLAARAQASGPAAAPIAPSPRTSAAADDGAERLLGIVRDGDVQLAITGTGTRPHTDGAVVGMAREPGHIELPHEILRPSGAARDDRAPGSDTETSLARAAERLGILVPAHDAQR
jgi:hypothetical protein